MLKVNCKFCDSEISGNASICPVCGNSQTKKSRLARILGYRDVITFPTAITALIAAVYTPFVAPVQRFLGLDDAQLEAAFLNPDLLEAKAEDSNSGSTDSAVIPMMRVLLSNSGHTLGVVLHNFVCVGDRYDEGNLIFTFRFFDPKDRKTAYPALRADTSQDYFARLDHAQIYAPADWPIERNNFCKITFTDKHGVKNHGFELNETSKQALTELLN